jgi:hypothetical protein
VKKHCESPLNKKYKFKNVGWDYKIGPVTEWVTVRGRKVNMINVLNILI